MRTRGGRSGDQRHGQRRLWLLPSGPDQVHGTPAHWARPSSSRPVGIVAATPTLSEVTESLQSTHDPLLTRRGSRATSARVQRGSKFLLLAVRLIFVALLVVITTVTVASSRSVEEFGPPTVVGLIIAAVGVGAAVLLIDYLTPNKSLTSVAGVYIGICAGLVAAVALGALIDTVATAWEISKGPAQLYLSLTKIILGIVLCYLAVSIVLTTKEDFRLVIPYVEFDRQPGGISPILLDSSTLVDGRIEGLATSRLLDAAFVVPKFVLDELQALCDSDDRQKRLKGRRALDLVARLQATPAVDIRIEPIDSDGRGVDKMLVDLAQREHMRIATGDRGLQKVAHISGVITINIHEVADALRPPLAPGEGVTVEVTRAGEQPWQGVGHLPDGTMVVIDGAGDRLRERVQATISNVLQTAGGRIVFAKADGPAPGSTESLAQAATQQTRVPLPERDDEHSDGRAPSPPTSASPHLRNPRRT